MPSKCSARMGLGNFLHPESLRSDPSAPVRGSVSGSRQWPHLIPTHGLVALLLFRCSVVWTPGGCCVMRAEAQCTVSARSLFFLYLFGFYHVPPAPAIIGGQDAENARHGFEPWAFRSFFFYFLYLLSPGRCSLLVLALPTLTILHHAFLPFLIASCYPTPRFITTSSAPRTAVGVQHAVLSAVQMPPQDTRYIATLANSWLLQIS